MLMNSHKYRISVVIYALQLILMLVLLGVTSSLFFIKQAEAVIYPLAAVSILVVVAIVAALMLNRRLKTLDLLVATGDLSQCDPAELASLGDGFKRFAENAQKGSERLRELENELCRVQSGLEQRIRERTAELAVARDQALQSNRTKSAFLANMSHELRTPLNAILGYSEILEEEAVESGVEEFATDLRKIKSAGSHLLALISDILDLSKIDAGKMELDLEPLEITSMLLDVRLKVEPLIAKNNNRFNMEPQPELGTMVTDPGKLTRALVNLLANAAKFTQNGEIGLSVKKIQLNGSNWVAFSVTDTGIGISSEQIQSLFKEFSQVDVSTTRKYGGTGLGLTISKRYCEMLGGNIEVESGVERGAVFTIKLPEQTSIPDCPLESNERVERALVNQVGDRRARISSILLINDASNKLLADFLQKSGFNVSIAESGHKGLRLARQINPDAILIEPQVSEDAWVCLQELSSDSKLQSIPVIVLGESSEKTKAYALGVREFVEKPLIKEQLEMAIKRCIRKEQNQAVKSA